MTPIEKNIIVVDEQGNEYEATYLKRAKGLVKNGRARFLSENKICLACPPDTDLEDKKMTENIDIGYIFRQLEEIQKQTGYLSEALNVLAHRPESDSGEPGSPGNIAEQEIASSIGSIVRCRETTNQKLIEFYGMVYRDLRGMGEPSADSGSAEKKPQGGNPLAELVSASKAFANRVKNAAVSGDSASSAGDDITVQVSGDMARQAGRDIAHQVSNDIARQVGKDIIIQMGDEKQE